MRTLWHILKYCLFGHHDWIGLTDGKRTLYVCEHCIKRTWKEPKIWRP